MENAMSWRTAMSLRTDMNADRAAVVEDRAATAEAEVQLVHQLLLQFGQVSDKTLQDFVAEVTVTITADAMRNVILSSQSEDQLVRYDGELTLTYRGRTHMTPLIWNWPGKVLLRRPRPS